MTVPLNVYTGLGDCSGVFGSSPPISDGRLTLVGDTPQQHAACWLARLFGPKAAPTMTARPQHVQLGSAGRVKLVADLFVSGAGQLVIDWSGNRATVVVGEWQIRVQHGAELPEADRRILVDRILGHCRRDSAGTRNRSFISRLLHRRKRLIRSHGLLRAGCSFGECLNRAAWFRVHSQPCGCLAALAEFIRWGDLCRRWFGIHGQVGRVLSPTQRCPCCRR